MKASYKILLSVLVTPLLYVLLINGLLRHQYDRGKIKNAEMLHLERYSRTSLPAIADLHLSGHSPISVVCDGANYLELEKFDGPYPVKYVIEGTSLTVENTRRRVKGILKLQNVIIHVRSGTRLWLDNANVNLAAGDLPRSVMIHGDDSRLNFIHEVPSTPICSGPVPLGYTSKSESQWKNVTLLAKDCKVRFAENTIIDTLSGQAQNSEINCAAANINFFDLSGDDDSAITVSGKNVKSSEAH